jgi:alpha-1,3-rhamnosyltransferase
MLSILIPSYNHARYIEEAIASARRIGLLGQRIIVIDDASTDDSVDVVTAYLKREGSEGIELVTKPVNRGAIDSVHMFLSMCRTEYVYFMASDDVVVPEGIAALVGMLQANPGFQFAIGGGFNLFPNGARSPIYGPKHSQFFAMTCHMRRKALFLDCPSPILCQSSVFRLGAINAVGGFDKSLVADDYALFTKLFLRYDSEGSDFAYVPETPCVLYRHHGVNSYHNLRRQALATRQVLDTLAPRALRARAVGYMLAYYALVALRRADFLATRDILKMVQALESPWFAAGLVRSSLKKLLSI